MKSLTIFSIIAGGLALIGATLAIIVVCMYFSYSNQEVGLRNLITAKIDSNKNSFDNMWKTIKQTAQVTDAQKSAIMDIVVGYAEARKSGAGSLATMVHEAVPNVDATSAAFTNLQNTIVSCRSGWKRNQDELIELSRAHTDLRTKIPSSWFIGGRPKIDIPVITSERTETTFQTRQDNDVDLDIGHGKQKAVEK